MNNKLKLLINQIIALLHTGYYGKIEINIEDSKISVLNVTESIKFKENG